LFNQKIFPNYFINILHLTVDKPIAFHYWFVIGLLF